MEDVAKLCDPTGTKDLERHDQLSMGDYQRVLENGDCWQALGWPLDRKVFCARLKQISQIRNNIMHFNNDPLPEDVLAMLRNFANLLDEYN